MGAGWQVLLLFAVLASGPPAVRALRAAAEHRRARRPRSPGIPGIPQETLPIERLTQDLHRLLAELDRIEGSDLPAKAFRLRAASLAYDDLLLAACRTLDLEPAAARPPFAAIERIEVEAELARHGLTW